MVQGGRISHGTGKELLARMVADGIDPEATVEAEGLAQLSDTGEPKLVLWPMRREIVFAAWPATSTNWPRRTRPLPSTRPWRFSVRLLYQPAMPVDV